MARVPGAPQRSPEAAVSAEDGYIAGMGDLLLLGCPEAREELQTEVRDVLCRGEPSDALVLGIARLIQRTPQVATIDALDCALARHETEDAVLAGLLDAYGRSGFRPSPAWEAWRAKAASAGIRRRFEDGGPSRR